MEQKEDDVVVEDVKDGEDDDDDDEDDEIVDGIYIYILFSRFDYFCLIDCLRSRLRVIRYVSETILWIFDLET